ncbi:NAD(P)H-dependent flavin oxidoreductase [Branchiibius cervicis]|uniref:NAD(P)H-dependent flavin oxidoreductase n=1 Tax=Branchiibius cervicis TaxID=908252 RepID=A0ABW2AWB9_9MICO
MALPPVLSGPLSVPVVASPMFIASGPDLVVAQCTSGIIGSFPALNARPASLLGDWLDEITERCNAFQKANPDAIVAPFAVNQIVHRSNDRLEQDMATIVEHQVPIVITSSAPAPRSTRRCIPTAGSSCTTSSTMPSRTRQSRREPTA